MASQWLGTGNQVEGSRIQIYLPVNDNNERLAATRVVTEMYTLHGGVTHSPLSARSFRGYCYDNDQNVLYQDEIAIAWVDVPKPLDSSDLRDMVRNLRTRVSDLYDQFGSRQSEIWITIEWVLMPA